MAITISDDIFDIYNDGINALYANSNTSDTCKIYYPANQQECPNCIFDTFGAATNSYKDGGPVPFNFGLCPVCNGVGFKEVEVTENVILRIYPTPKYWIKIAGVDKPDGKVQIIGKIADMSKIIRSSKIELFTTSNKYTSYMCVLDGEPSLFGFGSREFVAMLRRV